MKKLVIIFALLLLAAGCDKIVVSQSGNSSLTQTPTSTLQVITIPDNSVIAASTTPIATSISTVKPRVVKKISPQQEAQSPAIVENPVVTPSPQPTQTQQPAVVCNNVSGGSLPAGWYSDGQGNCSATSPQQQAATIAAQQQATQQAQQQANQQAAQAAAAQAQQQKTNQINALTSQYNTQLNALNQQIIDIKNQYYIDLANIQSRPEGLAEQQGEEQNLLNKDNAQIAQIQLQEQQLYVTYQSQLNALK